MILSVNVKYTDRGYVPELVYETPRIITVFSVGDPCHTWKEAYIIARAVASSPSREWTNHLVKANA